MTDTDRGPRPRLLSPPQLRAVEQGHRSASWLELFFDLVFVIAIAQLATLLAEDASPAGYAGFVLLLVPVWWAWVGYTMYADRFDTDDLAFRLLMAAGMVAVGVLVVAAPTAWGATSMAFAVGYALNRSVLIALYLRALRYVPAVRPLVAVSCAAYATGSALWLCSLLLPVDARPAVWLIAVLVEGAVPWVFRRAMSAVPTHATHLPERFGLFTILVIGELLVAIVLGIDGANVTVRGVIAAVAGFLVAFALWWIYFDALRDARIRPTLLARNAFIYAHLPLALGLVTAAVGIKKAVSGADAAPTATASWLLGAGLAVVLVSTAVLVRWVVGPVRAARGLLVGAVALLVLAAAGPALPPLGAILLAVGILAVVLTTDVFRRRSGLVPAGLAPLPDGPPD